MSEPTTNVPEIKTVVVYDSGDIEKVLGILDKETPVTGIETMRNVVNVFDIIRTKGFVQQAQAEIDHNNIDFNPSYMVDPEEPQFKEEGEPLYESEDDYDSGEAADVCVCEPECVPEYVESEIVEE